MGKNTLENELDALIDACALEAQVETGVNTRVLAARNGMGGRGAFVLERIARKGNKRSGAPSKVQNARWTQEEEEFVRAHLGILSEQDIADALGRSRVGVHIHSER